MVELFRLLLICMFLYHPAMMFESHFYRFIVQLDAFIELIYWFMF